MKKIKHQKLIGLFAACATTLYLGGLFACAPEVQAATPSGLKIEDEVLSWEKVDGASKYLVNINGTEYETQTNSFDTFEELLLPNRYEMKVRAVGEKTTQSEWSESVFYTIYPSPVQLRRLIDGSWGVASVEKSAIGKVIIPAYGDDNMPVSRINWAAFENHTQITSVYIPSTVVGIYANSIQDNEIVTNMTSGCASFTGCTSLRRVHLSENVTKFTGFLFTENLFENCDLIELKLPAKTTDISGSLVRGNANLASVTIAEFPKVQAPDEETEGGEQTEPTEPTGPVYKVDGNCLIEIETNRVVIGCTTSVIPDYVTGIGIDAFNGRNIETMSIPEGVTAIADGAFASSKTLKRIEIGENVTSLGKSAFQESTALEELKVAAGNPLFVSENCCILLKDTTELYAVSNPEKIAPSATVIGDRVFSGFTFTEFTIPDHIESIGRNAFSGCRNLKSIAIPGNVTTIGDSAFSSCTNLASVSIGRGVKSIGNQAFYHCNYLYSVTFSDTVTTVGRSVFEKETGTGGGWMTGFAIYDEPALYVPFAPDSVEFNNLYSDVAIFWNCEMGYDGTIPYVLSVTYSNEHAPASAQGNQPIPARADYQFGGFALEEGGEAISVPTRFTSHLGNSFTAINVSDLYNTAGTPVYALWTSN